MFQRIFATALGAGIGVGLLVAALQHVTLVPMILEAEKYESGAAEVHKHTLLLPWSPQMGQVIGHALDLLPAFVGQAQGHGGQPDATPAEESASPWRAVLTTLATMLTSVGFALLLSGIFAVSGREVDAREGLLWGLAGFAVFQLAPAFGLPPELPGSVAADVVTRQVWWVGTVVATATALGLAVFVPARWAYPLAIALFAAPHIIGAPHPGDGAGLVPPELAASFAARSLGINAVFWALLGLSTGALYVRFGRAVSA
jgi:cobalt transporter subunit CbtA